MQRSSTPALDGLLQTCCSDPSPPREEQPPSSSPGASPRRLGPVHIRTQPAITSWTGWPTRTPPLPPTTGSG